MPAASPIDSILSYHALLTEHARSYPAKEAVIFEGERLTYGALIERADRVAAGLLDRGLKDGDRVLWLGQNCSRIIELLLACERLGLMLCVANWRQAAAELAFVLEDFAPAMVIVQSGECEEIVREARASANAVQAIWLWDGESSGSYDDLLVSPTSYLPAPPAEDRGLLVLYTAAFAGKPNGAIIARSTLYLQGVAQAIALKVDPADRRLVSTPLFHVLAWMEVCSVLARGASMAILRRTDAVSVCQAITHEKCTGGTLPPPLIPGILALSEIERGDLSEFSSACRVPGWSDLIRPGIDVDGYGQTETGGPALLAAPEIRAAGQIGGRAGPFTEVHIIDDAGNDVAPGEAGEIAIGGPLVKFGYWNRSELNAQRWAGDLWRTNDLGKRQEDGTIRFIGPKTAMIKSGGENVYPAEVEAALAAFEPIARAAVIGTSDRTWGQLVTAVVVLKPGTTATEAQIVEFLRARIARYKCPRIIHFADDIPMAGFQPDYDKLNAAYGGSKFMA